MYQAVGERMAKAMIRRQEIGMKSMIWKLNWDGRITFYFPWSL